MNITREEVQQVLSVLQEEADIYSEVPDSYKDCITLLQSKLAEPAHTDHPMRHYDGTCPACQKDDVEPVAYLAWRDGQPCWDEDCVCQDAVYPVDSDDDRTSMPVYLHPAPKPMTDEQAAAIRTLIFLGYTYHGAEQWKPPLGEKPEPVAWIAKQEDGGLLLWDASYKLIQEGYEFTKHKRLKYYPLYLGKS